MYYFYDATYILVIIGAIISLIASMNVKSTFNRYDKYNSRSGLTGAMAAQEILRAAGITNVRIERVSGNLTDHYSPKEGVLRLSDSVYNSTSVAAIGVAAHECGHAMQYDKEYFPIKIRAAVIPIANIGSANNSFRFIPWSYRTYAAWSSAFLTCCSIPASYSPG